MRLFYCDFGLANFCGHPVRHCKSLVTEFRSRGLETVIIGAANVEAEIRQMLGVQPLFSPYYATDGDPFCGWLNAFATGWERTANDFAQIPGLRSDDVIYLAGTQPTQLYGLGHWIADVPPQEAPRVIVDLLHMPGLDLKDVRNGQEIWVTKDPRKDASAVLFRYTALFLKARKVSRLRFLTSAPGLIVPYSLLLDRYVGLLPTMPYDAPEPVRGRAGNRPITIAILGHQYYHKGYLFMPEVFEQLLRTRNDIRIIVHDSNPWPPQPEVIAALQSLAAADARLVIQGNALNDVAYKALLDSCDLVICPYNPQFYRSVYSGIVAECFARGIPMVLPGNTLVAKQFGIYGQSGTTFDSFDAPSILDATQRALDGFDSYAAVAVTAAMRWADSQGVKKYVDEILRVASDPSWI